MRLYKINPNKTFFSFFNDTLRSRVAHVHGAHSNCTKPTSALDRLHTAHEDVAAKNHLALNHSSAGVGVSLSLVSGHGLILPRDDG